MQLVPSKFFVTTGAALSDVSVLNAFDNALIKGGIGEQNLVPVSSVIPIKATRTERTVLPMGAVTHCVLARRDSTGGDEISAGIGFAMRSDGNGGYVAEAHGSCNADELRKELDDKLDAIAKARDVTLLDYEYAISNLKVPEGSNGCCIASLVFTEYRK